MPPSSAITVVILLSHETKDEVAIPSAREDSLLPYGSIAYMSATDRFIIWYVPLCILFPSAMFFHHAMPTASSTNTVGNVPYGVITSSSWTVWLEIDGIPALEMYPMISPVVGSVELLTDAYRPGTLVTTELQVLTLSAL